jgi:uncharacterized membrane protein YhaH (DUF805 family)
MANPVLRGFRNITRFSGRDRRGQFWPYVAVIIALMMVVNGATMSWMMSNMFADVQHAAATDPQVTTVHASPDSYTIQVEGDPADVPVPDFRIFFGGLAAGLLLAVGLMAAAVSRRLHDRDKSALWGSPPCRS